VNNPSGPSTIASPSIVNLLERQRNWLTVAHVSGIADRAPAAQKITSLLMRRHTFSAESAT
jgi:hypothetical protein